MFITPGAPHQNGCAEALVKTCKSALKKAVGSQVLTPLELYTIHFGSAGTEMYSRNSCPGRNGRWKSGT